MLNWSHDLGIFKDYLLENTRIIFVANPNNPTVDNVSLVSIPSGWERLESTMKNATAVSKAKVFNLKSPQSQGTPHSAEPQIGPEITTPEPKSKPRSEPVQKRFQPHSFLFKNHAIAPINNKQKARKEVQAKGTCQNNIRYASGDLKGGDCTKGAYV